jgi:uncharacterized membrane protein
MSAIAAAPPRSRDAAIHHRESRHSDEDPLEKALGWASLALGVPQIVAPGRFAESIGVRDDDRSRFWTRAVGVRELMAAAGILKLGRPRPAGWVWARVAGDVKDLTLLVSALRSKCEDPKRLLGAIGAVVGIMGADLYEAARLSRAPDKITEDGALRVMSSITVRQSRDEVYAFWHEFQNLPRFMAHIEAVSPGGDGRQWHWEATGPAGRTVEWDAEVVDVPGERIAWRSLEGSAVKTSGSVRFVPAPGGRGTEIHVDMTYSVPGGPLAALAAKLFGEEPEIQVKDDLRRLKQVMETGEVVRSEGSPEGPLARRLLKQRPAQPPEEPVAARTGANGGMAS